MLQTPAYAREVLAAGGLRGKELDQQVEARMGRRELLEGDDAPLFRTIISEAVLRTPLRDKEEWREQLQYLLDAMERLNVAVHVLLQSAGVHGLMSTDMWYLPLPDGRTVAYTENGYRGRTHPADVGGSDMRSIDLSAAAWRKSSYSNQDGGACLEVADGFAAVVPVRDSKTPHGPALVFPVGGRSAFVGAVRGGQLGSEPRNAHGLASGAHRSRGRRPSSGGRTPATAR
ncbi:hypothetical protein GCM10009863_46040 [Streptomyces axinellae]|uniref:DUF397 domain-containing protein n=1 Tax=Streptomyces axinellae TaxID=552788 RepID=A0ABP6CU78_9ACTN